MLGEKVPRWLTVYDVTRAGWVSNWPFVGFAVTFAIFGGLMVFWWPRPFTVTRSRVLGGLFVAIGLLVALFGLTGDLLTRSAILSDLRPGSVQHVEGTVTNFVAMPPYCHGTESFDVSQTHFAYADAEETGGFNHSSTCGGGPFHPGERVRLDYVVRVGSNVIVRAEIAE
jgi:hypothetical protein